MQQQTPQPITESKVIGVPTSRIDGPLKTTGSAMYSSDHHFENLVYAWPTTATISSGTISSIDTSVAEKMRASLQFIRMRISVLCTALHRLQASV